MISSRRRFFSYVAGAFVAGSFRCLAPAPAALAPSAIGGLTFVSFAEILKRHYSEAIKEIVFDRPSPLFALIEARGRL